MLLLDLECMCTAKSNFFKETMASTILNIETSTKNCSVSLSENGKLIAHKEINDGNYSHAENLHPFIDAVLQSAIKTFKDLTAIAVSKGPGSYTGLRIGVSAAKGLSFALDIPLLSVNTLTVLAYRASAKSGVIIPVLDARRMEVYQAVYDKNYDLLENTNAVVVDANTYDKYLSNGKVHFLGDAVEKIKPIIEHPNAVFMENQFPSAKEMASLSYKKLQKQEFEDVAYFEPFYLKDFIAIKSSKRV